MGTHRKIIPDDEIKYVPKEKLNEFLQEVSAATEFSVVKTGHTKKEKDLISQIAESGEEDEDNISDKEFEDLTSQIKAKIAEENPELVKAAEAEKRAKTMTEEQAMKELKEVKKPAANGIFGAVKLR